MRAFIRVALVVVVAIWTIGTLGPRVACLWIACARTGLNFDYDGYVDSVDAGSPAARASIVAGDRIVAPLARGLDRDPPKTLSLSIQHGSEVRHVVLVPQPMRATRSDDLRFVALLLSYLIFVAVGSSLLLLRPSPTTWIFYLYCVLRRYGDLYFYWPDSDEFFWFYMLVFGSLGGADCALVTMFALRFPRYQIVGWRRSMNYIAIVLAVLLPVGWLIVLLRFDLWGVPSQALTDALVRLTSAVYFGASAIFLITLFQSHGDQRQRLQWILVFPVFLLLRVAVINLPDVMPPWVSDALIAIGVFIPLTVAYAVIRQRVFDVQFVISRALVYGTLT